MKIKMILGLIVILLLTTACSDATNNNNNESENNMNQTEAVMENSNNNEMENEGDSSMEEEELPVFTAETLAMYNGKDGNPAYVAVDGVVYDVTDVAAWQTPHAGRLEPGKDYSKEIMESPHGKKNLEGLPVVGTYEASDDMSDMDMKVFDAEMLAMYNGKDGNPAYVAVDGVVYDVTDVAAWQTPHAGRLEPGKDYSKEIMESPHGKKNLEGLPVVGTYEASDDMSDMDMKVFDAETLAMYNGKDDNPAYVAVDGVVYDVTDVAAWQTPHAGRLEPGKDYSNEIMESPHGKKNLEGLEVVGTYEE